jgi:DNA primase
MFPIRAVQGEIIGFGGRVLDDSKPKYINSPETPVFSKGRELYGLYEARQALREKGFALVVEGFMDVVALAQSGFGNAVATLGTACTAEHVQKLFRFTDAVVFSFDGDAAGRRAAARALEAALPHATDLRSVRFLFLPPEHDPDSYVRELGPEAFERALAQAVPLSRQLVEQAAEDADLATAEGRARMLAQARPMWSALPDGALRDQLLGDLAEHARVPRDDLATRWGVGGRGGAPRPPRPRRPLPPRPQLGAADHAGQALRLLMWNAAWWAELAASDHEMLCQLESWHGRALTWLDRHLTEHGDQAWPQLRESAIGEPWHADVCRLVDGREMLVPPTIDELHLAVRNLREAPLRQEADRIKLEVMNRRF